MTRESSAQPHANHPPYPRPFLTREETNRLLERIGFKFKADGTLDDGVFDNTIRYRRIVRDRLEALETLLGGAIAEWTDIEPTEEGQTIADIDAELQEWTEEWLFG